MAASLVAMGCHGELESDEQLPIVRLSPSSVSSVGAWSLFDRSLSSGFRPEAGTVRVILARPEQLSQVKLFGSAAYRVRVTGRDGASIGLPTIDLSTQGDGWHTFSTKSLVSTDIVELRFEATGAGGTIPELELWGVSDRAAVNAEVDLSATDLSQPYVVLQPATRAAELLPGECFDFDVAIATDPSQFLRTHLVYATEGVFRSFSLRRSINGRAEQGGTTFTGDTGERTVVEKFDSEVLQRGDNVVQLCLPRDAARGAVISDLRIVGELDHGNGFVAAVELLVQRQGVRSGHRVLRLRPTIL